MAKIPGKREKEREMDNPFVPSGSLNFHFILRSLAATTLWLSAGDPLSIPLQSPTTINKSPPNDSKFIALGDDSSASGDSSPAPGHFFADRNNGFGAWLNFSDCVVLFAFRLLSGVKNHGQWMTTAAWAEEEIIGTMAMGIRG